MACMGYLLGIKWTNEINGRSLKFTLWQTNIAMENGHL
jgi:hypothetical protein